MTAICIIYLIVCCTPSQLYIGLPWDLRISKLATGMFHKFPIQCLESTTMMNVHKPVRSRWSFPTWESLHEVAHVIAQPAYSPHLQHQESQGRSQCHQSWLTHEDDGKLMAGLRSQIPCGLPEQHGFWMAENKFRKFRSESYYMSPSAIWVSYNCQKATSNRWFCCFFKSFAHSTDCRLTDTSSPGPRTAICDPCVEVKAIV